jgi:ATP-dependent Lon protease
MSCDNKINKKDKNICSKKQIKKNSKMKKDIKKENSDDSESDDSCNDSDEDDDSMFDVTEYRKFLGKLFPSKFLNKKIKKDTEFKSKIKEMIKNSESESEEEDSDYESIEDSSEEDSDEDDDDSRSSKDASSDSVEEEVIDNSKSKNKKTNVITVINKGGNLKNKSKGTQPETSPDESSSSRKKSNKNNEKNSKGDKVLKTKKNKNDSESGTDDSCETKNKQTKLKGVGNLNLIINLSNNDDEDEDDYEESINSSDTSESESDADKNEPDKISYATNIGDYTTLLTQLKQIQDSNKNNVAIGNCITDCETKLQDNIKLKNKIDSKQIDKNCKEFKKYIDTKNLLNDFNVFKKLDVGKQQEIINELKNVVNISKLEKPYRLSIIESSIPTFLKNEALKKISTLKNLDPGSSEYYKIKNWVDTFMRIPFNKYKDLPINIKDGIDNCHEFMEKTKQVLNDAVYGLDDAKMQIMQMLGQLVTNPKSIGTSLAIHGPPGSGKTSLVKEGISKILNRPFAFIALGGATDSSFLEGHSYTYEGSTWGKIVQILIESQCMNPVIYFDELDKISETPKGDEIIGILTHLTDTSQNSNFRDKYFSEVDLDLSKCLFIFSYNDENKVNKILRDRMYRIQTKGYDKKQKIIISNNYLLPKIQEQIKFAPNDIQITEEALNYIIDNNCEKESGVRNLKRCLEIIYTKLNLYRLMKPGSSLFGEEMLSNVTFPFKVDNTIVHKLIKKNENDSYLNNLYI